MITNQIQFFDQLAIASTIPMTGFITPPQIATAYHMPPNDGSGTRVGIISLGGGFLQSDLDQSMADLGLPSPTITQVLLNGETGTFGVEDGPSLENTLDIYCIASLVPSADIRIYIANNSINGFNDAIWAAINEECDIITISWGIVELAGWGDFLQKPLDAAAAKNISVFAASGDFGSASTNSNSPIPSAGYPASNPNVIAVGGTRLTLTEDNLRATEEADPYSGGGLSIIFPKPSYQHNCYYTPIDASSNTQEYITQLTVRGVPDIAAPMENYVFYFGGQIVLVGGTSAATPVMAGMVARFKSLLGRRLGNLNPIFYSNLDAFSDLTSGYNTSVLDQGHLVTKNWDPVVGLGAPDASYLYQILNSSSNIEVKDEDEQWQTVTDAYIKISDNAWKPLKDVWVKTDSNTWTQVY